MNIGVYVDDFSNIDQMEGIAQELNKELANKKIVDASLFYNGVCHTPIKLNFGLFNSTDLWNFDGYLIVTNLNSLISSLNIVNKINIFYYYGWENKLKALDILFAISRGVQIICRNEEDASYIKRITGKNPTGLSKNFENIVDILKGQKNG
jgi:hypothetical protein